MRQIALLGVIAALVGCAPPPPPAKSSAGAAQSTTKPPAAVDVARQGAAGDEVDANVVLQRLLAAYRSAKTYQDEGVVRLAFRQGGEPVSQEWPVSLSFERPNRLSLVAYQATVKSDGKLLRAKIDDPISNNLDHQILERPAPQELKPNDLASDPLLYDIVASRLRRQPIQLELLLESSGLVSAFGRDVACRRLDDATHGGRACFRVEVPSPGGPFVFWVDQADYLLRRLDYPAAALVPDLVSDPSVSDVQLLADLRGARIGPSIDAVTFAMPVPPGSRRMKTFVVPPQPLPSELFGRRPEAFYFTGLDQRQIGQRDLDGKIAVLAWYHDDPACEATLQQVALAAQRLQDDPDVKLLAIATDPTSTSNQHIARRLQQWHVELPAARDLEAFGDKVFGIKLHPAVVVLDAEGKVQIFQVGGNPDLAGQLTTIVERLKSGDDLAGDIVARAARERQQYEELVARGGPEPGEIVELPEAVIRRRSEPQHLRLSPLWSCTELKSPGNIVVAEQPGHATRLYIVEGWRGVAEVDAQGKIVARHELELPEEAAVTFARSAVDKEGAPMFVATAPLANQVFVFDQRWSLVETLPNDRESPLNVVDLALADLKEEDGRVDIVAACVADLGLIALSTQGEVLWRNRTFPNAVSVALSPPDDLGQRALFVTGESGEVLRVNRFGHEDKPVKVPNWPILRISGGRFTQPTQAALLGLSHNVRQETFAVGLSHEMKECWNYPLPAGMHQRPIEPVTSSELLPGRRGEWWLAGPDGSIHVISEDGEFFDAFHYGAALTGLAATRLDQQAVLLVATEAGLDAWVIEGTNDSAGNASSAPAGTNQSTPPAAPPTRRGVER